MIIILAADGALHQAFAKNPPHMIVFKLIISTSAGFK